MASDDYNKYFWGFIYLITKHPEFYLNNKGKIIYKIVINNGECKCIKEVSKFLDVYYQTAGKMCKEMSIENHLKINKTGNKKKIYFDDKILEEGIKIAKLIAK